MRAVALLLALALPLALGACGGSDAREASTQARQAAADQDADAPPEGSTVVPEALRGFRCESGDDGDWFATGSVKNDTKHAVAYRVSVQVGAAGDDVAASTVDVPAVAAGKKADFTFETLPAAGSDGPCRVQVLAVPPEG